MMLTLGASVAEWHPEYVEAGRQSEQFRRWANMWCGWNFRLLYGIIGYVRILGLRNCRLQVVWTTYSHKKPSWHHTPRFWNTSSADVLRFRPQILGRSRCSSRRLEAVLEPSRIFFLSLHQCWWLGHMNEDTHINNERNPCMSNANDSPWSMKSRVKGAVGGFRLCSWC